MKKMLTFWPWLATVGVAWSLGFFITYTTVVN